MKTFPILILLFAFACHNQQQEAKGGFTNKAEAKNQIIEGYKQGKWVEYIVRKEPTNIKGLDTLAMTLTIYKDGKPTELVRNYYPSGKLMAEVPYSDGKKNGLAKAYGENGKLLYETNYVNDSIQGKAILFDENGNERKSPY